jgi:hypothetical protein
MRKSLRIPSLICGWYALMGLKDHVIRGSFSLPDITLEVLYLSVLFTVISAFALRLRPDVAQRDRLLAFWEWRDACREARAAATQIPEGAPQGGWWVFVFLPIRLPLTILLAYNISIAFFVNHRDSWSMRFSLGIWIFLACWILPFFENRSVSWQRGVRWGVTGLALVQGVSLGANLSASSFLALCAYAWGSAVWVLFFHVKLGVNRMLQHDFVLRLFDAPILDALYHCLIGILCATVFRSLFFVRQEIPIKVLIPIMMVVGLAIGWAVTLLLDTSRTEMSKLRRWVWGIDGAIIGWLLIMPMAQATGVRSMWALAIVYGLAAALTIGNLQSILLSQLPIGDRWSNSAEFAYDGALDSATLDSATLDSATLDSATLDSATLGAPPSARSASNQSRLLRVRNVTAWLLVLSPLWLLLIQGLGI